MGDPLVVAAGYVIKYPERTKTTFDVVHTLYSISITDIYTHMIQKHRIR